MWWASYICGDNNNCSTLGKHTSRLFVPGRSVFTDNAGVVYGPLPTTVLAATLNKYSELPKRAEAVTLS